MISASLSPTFLTDLGYVHATLQPEALSTDFLSSLTLVHATLPTTSDDNLLFLASRFDDWKRVTKELVRTRLAQISDDDPLRCPISLFRTMDSGRLETAHTQTLAWLLDNKEHGFGDALLAALVGQLADREQFDRFEVENVVSEHPLDTSAGQGRLDVLAKGGWEIGSERVRFMLVIEAKVDASESEGQLDMYDDWLSIHAADREIFRVFLTPDSHSPETGCEDWLTLSFQNLVQIFRKVYPKLKRTPGFHFLRFYLSGVLQDICGWPREVTADTSDPYAVASYLRTVHDSVSEGATHGLARETAGISSEVHGGDESPI